jgi:hypothetical protein
MQLHADGDDMPTGCERRGAARRRGGRGELRGRHGGARWRDLQNSPAARRMTATQREGPVWQGQQETGCHAWERDPNHLGGMDGERSCLANPGDRGKWDGERAVLAM